MASTHRPTSRPFVLLVESHRDRRRQRGFYFDNPRRVIACRDRREVRKCLDLVDEAVRAGHYAAGFLAYEAGFAFESTFAAIAHPSLEEHLVWFGVFDDRRELEGEAVDDLLIALGGDHPSRVDDVRFDEDRDQYFRNFERIHEYIRAGDTYQVCYSFRSHVHVDGPPAALFRRLQHRQITSLSTLIDTGEYSVVSLSPELFFRKTGAAIELRPMKGTSPRGRDADEDAALAQQLRADIKTRAENVMIVDLLRNDIGKLADTGSVHVPDLFHVEAYESVLQVTSMIRATVDPATSLHTLFSHLFPCGSITGAPKIRTMEIIHELERAPRGIYCGSIGYVTPQNDACFNVAIRTMLLTRDGKGTLGIGSGVVIDSGAQSEFDECRLKGSFLTSSAAHH